MLRFQLRSHQAMLQILGFRALVLQRRLRHIHPRGPTLKALWPVHAPLDSDEGVALFVHTPRQLFRFDAKQITRMCGFFGLQPHMSLQNGHTKRLRNDWFFALSLCVMVSDDRHKVGEFFGLYYEDVCKHYKHFLEIICAPKYDVLVNLFEHPNRAALLDQRILTFADAISKKSGIPEFMDVGDGGIVEVLRIYGFLDGTGCPLCRLGGDPIFQECCFDGHHHQHCLSALLVNLPNGLIGFSAKLQPGRKNDISVQKTCGIEKYHVFETLTSSGSTIHILKEDNPNTTSRSLDVSSVSMHFDLQLYGDKGMHKCARVVTPFNKNQVRLNQTLPLNEVNERMSAVRVSQEWGIKMVKTLFPLVKEPHRFWLEPVEYIWKAACILANLHCCFHSNQISQYFNVPPPPIEELFRLL